MLDDMSTEYEEFMNKWLEDTHEVFKWGVSDMNEHTDDAKDTITKVAEQYGLKISDNLSDMMSTDGKMISEFDKTFKNSNASVLNLLDKIYDVALQIASGNNVKDKVLKEGSTDGKNNTIGTSTDTGTETSSNKTATGKWKKDKKGWWYSNADGSYAKSEYVDGYWMDSNGYWDNGAKAMWKRDKQGWYYQDTNGWYPKNKWLKIDGKWYYFDSKGYMVTGEQTINGKKYKFGSNGAYIKAYATGAGYIGNNQLAWTQDGGSEMIYRKTDGAVLTPLNRGDMVFTSDMSKNLWDIAKNPNILGQKVSLPSSALTARTVNNDNNLTIVLPNVMNYDQFRDAMMKDTKIQNYMQATTLGQALGKGKLNRGNL